MLRKLAGLVNTYGWQVLIEISILGILTIIQIVSYFVPEVHSKIQIESIFRVIVMLALGDILFRVINLSPKRLSNIKAISKDEEAREVLLMATRQFKIETATILSSGIGSRQETILALAEMGVRSEVLFQDPNTAMDINDGRRIEQRVETIRDLLEDGRFSNYCSFYPVIDIATIRAIVLYDARKRPKFAQLGWYTYHKRKDGRLRLLGAPHPSFIITNETAEGELILGFIDRAIQGYKNRRGMEE